LIRRGYKFSDEDTELLESLSEEEASALISSKRKLGDDFVKRNIQGERPPIVF